MSIGRPSLGDDLNSPHATVNHFCVYMRTRGRLRRDLHKGDREGAQQQQQRGRHGRGPNTRPPPSSSHDHGWLAGWRCRRGWLGWVGSWGSIKRCALGNWVLLVAQSISERGR